MAYKESVMIDARLIVANAQMLCDGLRLGTYQQDEEQFIMAATGAFAMLAVALDHACDLLDDIDYDIQHDEGGQENG